MPGGAPPLRRGPRWPPAHPVCASRGRAPSLRPRSTGSCSGLCVGTPTKQHWAGPERTSADFTKGGGEPTEALPGRKTETDRGTAVVPAAAKGISEGLRPATPGRVTPGGAEAGVPLRPGSDHVLEGGTHTKAGRAIFMRLPPSRPMRSYSDDSPSPPNPAPRPIPIPIVRQTNQDRHQYAPAKPPGLHRR